jgi:predicted nucleic acid-binding protein
MKYVDASAILRMVFAEPGPAVPVADGDRLVASHIVEVETYRAVDRERLLGRLDDRATATKRKELADVLAMLDLVPVDGTVIDRARSSFAINVRALDAIHVGTAEILRDEAAGEPLEFWTHDHRQALAAMSRGLGVHGMTSL